MTVRQDKDLLSKIQSSYLWTSDNEQPNDVTDISTRNLNINDGLQQNVSPRLNTIIEQPHVPAPWSVPIKEITATSLSEMQFNSASATKSGTAWSPTTVIKENSQVPLIESEESSKLVILSKTGRQVCGIRMCTIAVATFLFAVCAICIALPIGLVYRASNSITTLTIYTTTSSTPITSTTSTSTTTTSTTPPATGWIPTNYYTSCSSTCTNTSTVTPSTLLASWTFEENTNDVSGNGNNGQIVNGAAFTNGYIGQAILLQNSLVQFVNAPYINLANRSFTVETWIYLNSLAPSSDLDILGECDTNTLDKSLHYVVRQNKLYQGFLGDDLWGTTSLTTSTWYHAAFVYDYSLNVKSIYLNGILDAISTASGVTPSISAYLGASGNVTIGAVSIFSTANYWNGLLDQMTITNRVKTSCELLNDASLVAHFPFDNNYNDIGPNSMTGTSNPQGNSGLSWVSGQVNQALNINSSHSYFQSCGFYALGKNQPYSIAMWVNPSFQSGTLFHLSSAATGSGAWCLPMIGFSSNGSIVAQTWIGGTVSVMGPILPINTWTHIVQTYSSTNGLQLYINGGLYGSATVTTYSASNLVMCVTLGSSGFGTNCQTGLISMGPYSGGIDEFYVYNRELNALEVCPLAHP